MKTFAFLTILVLAFAGCESAKYAGKQMFGTHEEQREYGTFQTKTQVDTNSSVAAAGDDFAKNHLW